MNLTYKNSNKSPEPNLNNKPEPDYDEMKNAEPVT